MTANRPAWLSAVSATVYTLAIVSFLVYALGGLKSLAPALSVLSVIALLLSIPQSGWITKLFSLLFIGFGTWFILQKGTTIYRYLLNYGEMLYMLSLFAMVPLLATPIRLGRYDLAIQQILDQRVKTKWHFYRLVTGVSFLVGSILNLATIPMMYQSIKGSAQKLVKTNADKFIFVSILQGYCVTVAWTPLSGVVGIVLETTHVSWQSIFPKLFLISLAGLLLNWLLFLVCEFVYDKWRKKNGPLIPSASVQASATTEAATATAVEMRQEPANAVERNAGSSNPLFKLLQICAAIIILILLIVGVNKLFGTGVVVTATVVALPYAWAWNMLLGQGKPFWRSVSHYFSKNIPGMADQFAIFLSAGFFVQALNYSGYNHVVNQLFVVINHTLGVNVFLAILPFITLAFSFIGLHPVTVIILLAESLNPQVLGISAEQLTVAMIGGAVTTFMIGPFSASVGLISSMTRLSSFQVSTWSMMYTAGFLSVVVAFLLLF